MFEKSFLMLLITIGYWLTLIPSAYSWLHEHKYIFFNPYALEATIGSPIAFVVCAGILFMGILNCGAQIYKKIEEFDKKSMDIVVKHHNEKVKQKAEKPKDTLKHTDKRNVKKLKEKFDKF